MCWGSTSEPHQFNSGNSFGFTWFFNACFRNLTFAYIRTFFSFPLEPKHHLEVASLSFFQNFACLTWTVLKPPKTARCCRQPKVWSSEAAKLCKAYEISEGFQIANNRATLARHSLQIAFQETINSFLSVGNYFPLARCCFWQMNQWIHQFALISPGTFDLSQMHPSQCLGDFFCIHCIESICPRGKPCQTKVDSNTCNLQIGEIG